MARQRANFQGAREEIVNVFYDKSGHPILEIGVTSSTERQPDGTLVTRKVGQNALLEDGALWNASQATGNEPRHLSLCPFCRRVSLLGRLLGRKASHGLVSEKRARHCVDCGACCCPKHAKRGRDRKWRCPSCDRKHRIAKLSGRMFFAYEER